MRVKTILVTVPDDSGEAPDLRGGISQTCAGTGGGGPCRIFSSTWIVAHGLCALFSRVDVYFYKSPKDSRPSPHDGPRPPS